MKFDKLTKEELKSIAVFSILAGVAVFTIEAVFGLIVSD